MNKILKEVLVSSTSGIAALLILSRFGVNDAVMLIGAIAVGLFVYTVFFLIPEAIKEKKKYGKVKINAVPK